MGGAVGRRFPSLVVRVVKMSAYAGAFPISAVWQVWVATNHGFLSVHAVVRLVGVLQDVRADLRGCPITLPFAGDLYCPVLLRVCMVFSFSAYCPHSVRCVTSSRCSYALSINCLLSIGLHCHLASMSRAFLHRRIAYFARILHFNQVGRRPTFAFERTPIFVVQVVVRLPLVS